MKHDIDGAAALAEAGADELVVPDTVGYADPAHVKRVFKAVLAAVGKLPVAAHFHDTRGTGLSNVTAALDCGVTRRHRDARRHRARRAAQELRGRGGPRSSVITERRR